MYLQLPLPYITVREDLDTAAFISAYVPYPDGLTYREAYTLATLLDLAASTNLLADFQQE